MNKVDSILKVPFSSLTLAEKLEIKRLGPHQPKDFSFSQMDGKKNRNFCRTWFIKTPWLTVSEERKSLFCFYCLLFGPDGERVWTKTGYKDLKHLSDKIKKHEECVTHLHNACKFKMFGTLNIAAEIDSAVKISVQKHNEQVSKNRHVVDKVIDCLKFCGSHELALRGHDEPIDSSNREHFLDLLSMIGSLDSVVDDHLNNPTVFNCTSLTIQNELVDAMYHIYMEDLVKDVSKADFVAVQVDETTDISCTSQFAIVLRFVIDSEVVERFVSFIDVNDRTCKGLFGTLTQVLNNFNIKNKLIAQAYDGANVMSGSKEGVQTLMQTTFPLVKYVNCYAHQSNLVIKNICSKSSKSVRIFFSNVTGFSTFFSESPKHSDVLRSVCNKIDSASQTRWDFHSRVVNSVNDLKEQLIMCFEQIEEGDSWDDKTIREAFGLKKLLQDEEFLYFLNFFSGVMKHAEILYSTIQKQDSTSVSISRALHDFESSICKIREDTEKYKPSTDSSCCSPPAKRRLMEENVCITAKEVCDMLINEMKERFQNSEIFSCFSIFDPKNFLSYKETFPAALVNKFAASYDTIIFKEKLNNELLVLYQNETFCKMQSISQLFRCFVANSFQDSFSETFKCLQITLTTPVATAESARCFSTLKRIKTYLRNTMGQERLKALAVCSIHREVIMQIPNFNNRVIDLFADRNDRRAHLLFK